MKSETVSGLGIALALALIAAALLAVYLIGGDRLYILAAILVGGLVIAGFLGGLALVIRAYRKNDNPPVIERHTYHEGRQIIRETRVIDGRSIEAPKIYQLPAQPSGGAFPELLRAAFQAGTLTDGRANYQTAQADRELRELDLDPDVDGWEGDVSP
jgi:hypothetical protein